MMTHPRHCVRRHALFVPALWRHVKEVVSSQQDVEAAPVSRVGAKDLSVSILVENAQAGPFFHREIDRAEVVRTLAWRHIIFRKRHLVVVVEIAVERRYPRKPPSHALLERLNLRNGRTRDDRKRRIALFQVYPCAVKVVCQERATRAALLPSRTEHEVIDNQLASSLEQLGQRYLARRSFEDVALLHLLPWKLAALAAQFVTQPGEFFLLLQERFSRRQPFRDR